MWLPRLMRAANEEQEQRAAAALSTHTAQNLFGTLVTCDCGHLASCRRTAALVCSRNDAQILKHRFTLVKWCCVAFLLLIFALIVFSGLLTSTPTELTSSSSYLFLAIIFTSLVLFAGLCCLRARTICSHRDLRHNTLHCRRPHNQSHSLRLPASIFAHSVHSRAHNHLSPNAYRFTESSFYNALLESCVEPLPSYNEAIKEPVFAPPAYSAVVMQSAPEPANVLDGNNRHQLNSAHSSADDQVAESSSSSDQELLMEAQLHAVETVTSVEVHQSDETDVEAMSIVEDKSCED